MKIYWITPGKELESVYKDCGEFGAASWYIEVRTNEETWEDEIEYNAFLKFANITAFCHFTNDNHDKFHELQEAVDSIWRESSDVKDFAKRLYIARISDRFFEEVEFDAEEAEESPEAELAALEERYKQTLYSAGPYPNACDYSALRTMEERAAELREKIASLKN